MSAPAMVSLLTAVDEAGMLVRRDGHYFRRPAEIDRIAQLTRGRVVILGRRTFSAFSMIPPDRWYLVVTRDEDLLAEGGVRYLSGYGYWFMGGFAEALRSAQGLSSRASAPEVFVAGGPQLFAEAMPLARRVYRMRADAPAVVGAAAIARAASDGWRRLLAEGSAAAPQFEIIERA